METSSSHGHDFFPKGPAEHCAIHTMSQTVTGRAEIFSNSYFCNISKIKAKCVKIPIKRRLTSLVSRQSVFARRQVLGSLWRPGETIGFQAARSQISLSSGERLFSNQDQFNSVI